MIIRRFDNDDNKQFMLRAINLAKENIEHGGGPFGCVIVKDGRVIGEGVNRVTNNNDPTAHAEIMAIRDACKNLNDYQLNGCVVYSSCEPCPMCLGAIYWARPAKIYFGSSRIDAAHARFDDYFIYNEINKPINSRNIPTEQLMGNEANEVFDKWMGVDPTKKVQY